MSKNGKGKSRPTVMDDARDELFSHINRCGVLRAAPEQQAEWMKDTIEFLAERYPALDAEEVAELEAIGMRFCSPVIPHGNTEDPEAGSDVEQEEPAAA